VVDANTEAPIDSAKIYLAYFNLCLRPSVTERHFKWLSGENGRFTIPVGCYDIRVGHVEKEAYLSAKKIVCGNGDPHLTLEKITPETMAWQPVTSCGYMPLEESGTIRGPVCNLTS